MDDGAIGQIQAWLSQNADWVLVALFGAGAGFADLITRYRDEPFRAVKTLPGIWYIVLNALASIFALALTRAFGWTTGVETPNTDSNPWISALPQSVAAGFGAVALLRTTFTFHAGDKEVTVGPRSFVEAVLKTTDNAVDRKRARERDKAISKAMTGISFSEARLGLPAYVFNLMQGVTLEQQSLVGDQVRKLNDATDMRPEIKSRILGLYLLNVIGEGVLLDAVSSLGAELKAPADSVANITAATPPNDTVGATLPAPTADNSEKPPPPESTAESRIDELLHSTTLPVPRPEGSPATTLSDTPASENIPPAVATHNSHSTDPD